MAVFVLSASASLPGVQIEGRVLYQWRKEMARQLRELEREFGDGRPRREQPGTPWNRRGPKPR